jgi:hypothetical protein
MPAGMRSLGLGSSSRSGSPPTFSRGNGSDSRRGNAQTQKGVMYVQPTGRRKATYSSLLRSSGRNAQAASTTGGAAGKGNALAAAFRHIVQRLENDPNEAGEPLYRLPALRMQDRCVVVRPLVVDFAVCEDQPLGFIKRAEMLSE